jgi:hypothetical protein
MNPKLLVSFAAAGWRQTPVQQTMDYMAVFDASISFHFGADGNATGITLYQNGRINPPNASDKKSARSCALRSTR